MCQNSKSVLNVLNNCHNNMQSFSKVSAYMQIITDIFISPENITSETRCEVGYKFFKITSNNYLGYLSQHI